MNQEIARHQKRLIMLDEIEDDRFSTVSIVGIQNDKPTLDRTGVLLSVADLDFLVTASHDLEKFLNAGIPLYVTSPRKGDGGIPISGRVHGTAENILDVAVFKLDASTSQQIRSAGGKFLRQTDTDIQTIPIPGHYLIRGYPLEMKGNPIRFSTVLYSGPKPASSEYPFDPHFHLLLDHSGQIILNDGTSKSSPNVKGMSGCGIWRITSRPESEWGNVTKNERKLVAIQTSYLHGQYCKGTWIRHVWELIQNSYPETREIMSKLLLPR